MNNVYADLAMKKCIFIFVSAVSALHLFSVLPVFSGDSPDVHPVLQHYEILHVSDLRHNVLRTGLDVGKPLTRQIHFYCFGRSFSLHLEPDHHILSPNFQAHLVNGRDDLQSIPFNPNNLYSGHLIGDASSVVVTHLSDTGIITSHISTVNDTFYIEPAHLHISESHDRHMIVYRKSDARHNHLLGSVDFIVTPESSRAMVQKYPRRLKRQSSVRDTCTMILVADYRFFQFLRSSESNVIDTIVSRMFAVDTMSFRPSNWIINAQQDTITGRGLQIGRVLIHSEPTPSPHYNSIESGALGIQDLLRQFSRNDWSEYCLAHLMTHRRFASGKLGLAYIASPDADETGGICSSRVQDSATSEEVTYNTGISIVSTGDRLLLSTEAELVIAHEIGHNWGSPHDPGTDPDCTSSYLMNEFAQDGSSTTHHQFSPCSLVSIGRVLNNKAYCFETLINSTCGNFIVDDGEECDEGRLGSLDAEGRQPCCTTDCRLEEGLNCSDVNDPCCIDCQIAALGSKVCHVVGNVSRDCTSLTTCDGVSKYCPEPMPAELDSRCIDGFCKFNDDSNTTLECVPFCVIEGMESCDCTGDDQCLECCITEDGLCQPLQLNGELVHFPDGVICSTGFCSEGVCVDSSQDFASQLWSVITTLDINEYAQLMKENIVGVVLIVVTLFWVPGSCLFYYLCDVKKLWKRCLHRNTDSTDSRHSVPIFKTQTSWVQIKPEKTPLLSIEVNDDIPIEEPVDDTPLPPGFQ